MILQGVDSVRILFSKASSLWRQAPGPHRAEMIRCCGQLDKEEARGWLVNDAIGRPLLHRNDERGQNSAREVGKRVANAASAAETRFVCRLAVEAATHEPRTAVSHTVLYCRKHTQHSTCSGRGATRAQRQRPGAHTPRTRRAAAPRTHARSHRAPSTHRTPSTLSRAAEAAPRASHAHTCEASSG